MHLGTDIDDACLVEVAQGFLANIGNIAGNVFRPELGIAGHDFKFLNMD